nr:MAG TPA: hypothetical protein [Bacteriophage sp.]
MIYLLTRLNLYCLQRYQNLHTDHLKLVKINTHFSFILSISSRHQCLRYQD